MYDIMLSSKPERNVLSYSNYHPSGTKMTSLFHCVKSFIDLLSLFIEFLSHPL